MKIIIWIIIIAVLVFLFGSLPLSVISKLFGFLSNAFAVLAKWIDWSGGLI